MWQGWRWNEGLDSDDDKDQVDLVVYYVGGEGGGEDEGLDCDDDDKEQVDVVV